MSNFPLPTIRPDLSVQELLECWPAAAPVFVKRGMACVGCDLSSFETLANAAAVYNIPLTDLMAELERAITPDNP